MVERKHCRPTSNFFHAAWMISMAILAISYCSGSLCAEAFSVVGRSQHSSSSPVTAFSDDNRADRTLLHATKQSRRSTIAIAKREHLAAGVAGATGVVVDDEKPAGIEGAQFFGGNKQKEELFDPEAEIRAGEEQASAETIYNKFEDDQAFPGTKIQKLAKAVQTKINKVLYYDNDEEEAANGSDSPAYNAVIEYSNNIDWQTCFPSTASSSPLQELEKALEFYRRVDVAITSGKILDDSSSSGAFRVQLEWQISLLWPIYWEPRVLLTGNSILTVVTEKAENEDGSGGQFKITKQTDELDGGLDALNSIGDQVKPRFWDTYHIGMTPYAEMMTRTVTSKAGPLKKYEMYEIPSRLVLSPTQLDSPDDREDCNAQTVPNHAFSCVIKTVGPQKQRFVPTSPTEVQIRPRPPSENSSSSANKNSLQLKWSIPLSVEFQTNMKLPLPGPDPEANMDKEPECRYEFQERRRVATIAYGGSPQDDDIAQIRKGLYDSVVKDGFKPKLDESGRPQFFFLQNGLKSCFTEEGLGMCVYEWRPEFVKPNEVGLELEL